MACLHFLKRGSNCQFVCEEMVSFAFYQLHFIAYYVPKLPASSFSICLRSLIAAFSVRKLEVSESFHNYQIEDDRNRLPEAHS